MGVTPPDASLTRARLPGRTGKPIPHIDDQNEFGKNATCKLLLVSTSTFSILELEAGPDSAYALAAIEYTRKPGSNRSPDSRSHAAEKEEPN